MGYRSYSVKNLSLRRDVCLFSEVADWSLSACALCVRLDGIVFALEDVPLFRDWCDLECDCCDSSLIVFKEEPLMLETVADLLGVLNPDKSVCEGVSGIQDVLSVIELLFLGVLVFGAE